MGTDCYTHNTHDRVHYLHIDVTEVVGLAGSPPVEDGRVQMLSFVTEDKLSEVDNGVNISCRSPVSVKLYLLFPNTSISFRYMWCELLLVNYFRSA